MRFSVLTVFISIFICHTGSAQVVINEINAANFAGGGTVDGFGEYEDWIELYNPTGAAVDLGGYFLSDDPNEPDKWQIPAGTNIAANGHLLIYASGRDLTGPALHTSFKISQGKQEGAVLSDPSATIVDQYMLLVPNQTNHSRGRVTDGAAQWGVFTAPTPNASNTGALEEYAQVEIETAPGYYSGSVQITMSTTTPNATIYYTTDGTVPTTGSTQYTGPFNLGATAVVKARSFSSSPQVPPSFIETNTYLVNDEHQVAIVSVSGNQLPTLLGGQQIEPVGHFELFDKDGNLLAESGGDFNEHGNDSWAYPQRGIDYITQDEFGYGNEINYPIFRIKDRPSYQRVIIKAAASDNYPFEDGGAHIRDAYVQSLSQIGDLRVDERTYEPCVMYVNGEYWGVYEIREKVDDLDFTDYYYDQGAGFVDFLKTWGGTWEEYGSGDDWDDLRDFILGNDMTDPANYEYVTERYNTGSLIDYFTLNSYTVCADWLNWNTGWWRGRNPEGDKKKWRYILWDMDATFGHYVNFTGIPDQSANADLCDPEQLGDPGGQGHVPIWNTLLQNETFFAEYLNRFSDLSGTVFTCDFMHAHLDSLVGIIAPEMPRHITRWGGTMAEWEQNVQDIHDFIDTRCADINSGVIDCYPELSGPYEITLMANPPEGGRIDLSSMEISTYPFTTTYFGGINVPFDADENPGYVFSHWTSSNGTVFTPDELSEEIVVSFGFNDTLTAHFVAEEFFDITLNVLPANSGTITLNGTTYTSFPVNVQLPGSSFNDLSAEALTGYEFDYWTPSIPLDGTATTNPNSFIATGDGNITANFYEYVFNVTFDVSPPGFGTVTVNGELIEDLAADRIMQGGVPVGISTDPTDPFWEFSHWTTLSANPIPDENTADVEMTFTGEDLVVANYVEIPNYPLIIETRPSNVGYVRVSDTLITDFPYDANYIADEHLLIRAIERGKYGFSHWEVVYGTPMSYPEQIQQNYFFSSPTKLIAHFEERINSVYIPLAFSPNGDGINDIFKVYAHEIELDNFRLTITNRWGMELFRTSDIDKGWNGTDGTSDYLVPPGLYTFFVRYENSVTGEIVEKAGSITVIR